LQSTRREGYLFGRGLAQKHRHDEHIVLGLNGKVETKKDGFGADAENLLNVGKLLADVGGVVIEAAALAEMQWDGEGFHSLSKLHGSVGLL